MTMVMDVSDRLLLVAYEAQDAVLQVRSRRDLRTDPTAYVLALLEAVREGERPGSD